MTLYRTSRDGALIEALIEAAEHGVQVVALVELLARFDEGANIGWARHLEEAGAHVVYGLVGLKTHAKCVLVVRREGNQMRRYCHVGTGNYNESTAHVYEDVGLFTADPAVGRDVGELFNHLTGYSDVDAYSRLVVAPHDLRRELTRLIANEQTAGTNGHITIKVNALVDEQMIRTLSEASRAGVRVDLIIRGMCALRPNVKGQTETISVRSILGRYLEHSRIYRFANGSGPGKARYLIGSADLMERNLDRRVEVLVPIDDSDAQARLDSILEANMSDDRFVWSLGGDGAWTTIGQPDGRSSQDDLALAVRRAIG